MTFSIFSANTKAKAAEVNANFAFTSGERLIAINSSTGAAYGTFPIGDLTAVTNGSLVGDILMRDGSTISSYNASGALVETFSLAQSTESIRGTAKITTTALAAAGTDDLTIITPSKLLGLFTAVSTANKSAKLPANIGGAFSNIIFKGGTTSSLAGGASQSITFAEAFSTANWGVLVVGSVYAATGQANHAITAKSTTGFTVQVGGTSTQTYTWFAWGY